MKEANLGSLAPDLAAARRSGAARRPCHGGAARRRPRQGGVRRRPRPWRGGARRRPWPPRRTPPAEAPPLRGGSRCPWRRRRWRPGRRSEYSRFTSGNRYCSVLYGGLQVLRRAPMYERWICKRRASSLRAGSGARRRLSRPCCCFRLPPSGAERHWTRRHQPPSRRRGRCQDGAP
ncbi:hypothetical protein PVAP13_2NG348109 [Panicum virgatum]|uniref:Uncharacterized protein n=1 Tax=Panicum virgatum TaxID=38727 RepID=A0A8T0VV48_PANVG|nr:hypothetical protein PVAP13_2NG348109 [Panicum virgatum]